MQNDKILIALIILTVCMSLYLNWELNMTKKKLEYSQKAYIEMNQKHTKLLRKHLDLQQVQRDEIESMFEVREMEITYYAPLDKNAVEGICFSGDPARTASGTRPTAGRTIAMHSSVPFGTHVWIAGVGWRIVEDRGVGVDCVDIVVDSQQEAITRGRVKKLVVIYKGVER